MRRDGRTPGRGSRNPRTEVLSQETPGMFKKIREDRWGWHIISKGQGGADKVEETGTG